MSVIGIEILNFSKQKNVSLDELVAKGIENVMISNDCHLFGSCEAENEGKTNR